MEGQALIEAMPQHSLLTSRKKDVCVCGGGMGGGPKFHWFLNCVCTWWIKVRKKVEEKSSRECKAHSQQYSAQLCGADGPVWWVLLGTRDALQCLGGCVVLGIEFGLLKVMQGKPVLKLFWANFPICSYFSIFSMMEFIHFMEAIHYVRFDIW